MITSIGELLVDFLPIMEEGRTTGFSIHAGGAPYNVAVGLSRLEQKVAFAGKVSSDLFGRYLRECAEREEIDTRFLLTGDAPSTLAFVATEQGEPAYAFYDEGAADTMLTIGEVPPTLFEETSILHFGSISLLRGSTPAAVVEIVERLKDKALLSFDPNVRPGVVRNEQAYRALLDYFFSLADLVKLSAADIAWLAPGETVESFARELSRRGLALVVITRGEEGVFAIRGEEQWHIPPVPVQVVDTVGAGDAFSAGLLAGLAERGVTSRQTLAELPNQEIEASLKFASAVAALTCTQPGADPPIRSQLERFIVQA
ncbi:MAG: carbohydrate kinase [Chloroflexia bacterium]